MKNLYAVILVGGSGTRFWPLSRKEKPKQFLNITGDGTLLELTLKRIRPLIPADRVILVTNKLFRKEILAHAKRAGIPRRNILWEPEGKNTAPAILWAANVLHKRDPEAVMAVLPSDHLIANNRAYLNILKEAVQLAARDYLVTLGITPTRPDTGFGYLKTRKMTSGRQNILKVEQFTEKPSLLKAKQFLRYKNYFWNSGMFIWKASVIQKKFEQFLPETYHALKNKINVSAVWPSLKGISIDYGILEKADNVVAVEAKNIGWSDVGSWDALAELIAGDENGNVLNGNVRILGAKELLVMGGKKVIAAIGCEDLIIVDTADALLICKKGQSQNVREIVKEL